MRRLPLFFVLVFISGFSGLLYEVAWQRYLAILLGAQAWATALVLAVYLGGLSAGYFLFGALTRRYKGSLVIVYAGVEAGLAAWAFMFPSLFQWAIASIPGWHVGGGTVAFIVDISATIILLAVPTILMGGTLPLLTQGLAMDPKEVSQTHARIYGFNTIGACFGCLATGYWLIPALGLAATTRVGGILNAAVGVAAWFAARGLPLAKKSRERASRVKLTKNDWLILGIGFFSGFYLLALQTVLIRLMGLSSGASNYSFSLIVSIFVFCLGLGSLLARRIGEYKAERLFWNQAFAAFFLLMLYFAGDNWSYGAHVIRSLLRDIPEAFGFYQSILGTALFAMLVVPIGLSGLTLPLCFHLFKGNSDGAGHRVGLLYGVNTLGCIAGALVGGYWLLNFLNLDQVFKLCVLCVLGTAAAAAYLSRVWEKWSRPRVAFGAGLVSVVLAGLALAPLYHKDRFIQPFRHPRPMDPTFEGPQAFGDYLSRSTKLVFWKDGPNTSLGVGASIFKNKEVSRTIFVNGKSDGNTRGDLLTTNMLGHIPGLLADHPERVAVVGFGTGMTVGTLLHYPQVKSIDVVEISGTIIQNSGLFDNYNGLASRSPKVTFREMDAMRFLGTGNKTFDVIVSEPSNPWVAGVENLFSYEFYDRARSTLAPGGLFVQWIHAYSFTDSLFSMVVGTMGKAFPYVSVFQLKGGDYALVASVFPIGHTDVMRGRDRYMELPNVREDLALAGLTSYDLFLGLEVMGAAACRQISESVHAVHSLTHPLLSDAAARAFFVGYSVDMDDYRRRYKSYFSYLGNSLLRQYLEGRPVTAAKAREFQKAYCEDDGVKSEFLCREAMMMGQIESHILPGHIGDWVTNQGRALASLPLFEADSSRVKGEAALQATFDRFEAFKKYASPLFFVEQAQLIKPVDVCLKSTAKATEIWGQCQLQKVLILEWLSNPSPVLVQAKQDYLNWFPTLKNGGPNYEKLREARDILLKM
jgi:spermidine synthase